ncbi:uncharacterized protein LOC111320100, partial [Stylophora pistillata]|uniref:uncharacterized protein LOC111320100 n=1 Tax=Stylophora pistillata TaxID=50429 RepID=UPI000C04F97B
WFDCCYLHRCPPVYHHDFGCHCTGNIKLCKSWRIQWSLGKVWKCPRDSLRSYCCTSDYGSQYDKCLNAGKYDYCDAVHSTRPDWLLQIDTLLGKHVPSNRRPSLSMAWIVDYSSYYGSLVVVYRSVIISPGITGCYVH